jgi:MFS family permease
VNATFAAAMLAVVVTSGLRDPSGRTTGIILTLTGVGILIGSLAAADPRLRRHPRAGLLAACWIAAGAISVVALSPGSITAGVVIGVSLIAATIGNVAFITLATQLTPTHLLGRMQTAATLISSAATPIGPFAGGLFLELFGPHGTFLALGGVLAASAAFATAASSLHDLPQAVPAQTRRG